MKSEKEILEWLDGTSTLDDKENTQVHQIKKIAHYTSHIKTPEFDIDTQWEKFNELKQQNTKHKKVINLNFFIKCAAAILLLAIPTSYLYFTQQTTIQNKQHQNTAFSLPDHSKVFLNKNSEITYSKFNWKNNRIVNLKGEAFFEVEKGKKFSVKSNNGTVTVLGTKFNIKDHQNYYEVKCFEGLVSVQTKIKTVKLSKGQNFKISKPKVTLFQHKNKPEWLFSESVFTQAKLSTVLAKIEQQYHVTVKTNHINTHKLFSGSVTHQNLNIALKTITIPLNIKFSIENNIVTLYP